MRVPLVQPTSVQALDLRAGLVDVREFVRSSASRAGLSPDRVAGFVLAAHEVAMNALTHGRGEGAVRLWTADGELLCEVEDHGPGMANPSAGHSLPDPGLARGRGLWIARQLCERVEIETSPGGTRVRLRVLLDA